MTINLKTQVVPTWPKLAWVARFCQGQEDIEVLYGPMVEIGDDWCVEAVWSGDFASGDFDQTDLVFGSGIRCRDGRVIFVSAGTMLDRLWHCRHEGHYFVSNSLPAILACAKLSLSDDYLDYAQDIETMREGLNNYRRTIPTKSSDVHVLYYRNLVYDGQRLVEVDKPDTTPDFTCYADYYGFLAGTARRLKANLEFPERKHRVVPLTTISSGYDSGAAAVMAREAGCEDTVTIVNSSSLLERSDSGLEIARHLDLYCRTYRHSPKAYKSEAAIWAVAGQPAGLNISIFDFPQPLCLFFTGYRGDSIWSRSIEERSEPFSTLAIDGLGLCELRLIEGLFHCPVPFWGATKADQVQAISFLPEMEPWRVYSKYDRPIPRRMMEDAGVPRGLFGHRKEHTAANMFFRWPFTQQPMIRFGRFLKSRRMYAPSRSAVWLLRKFTHLNEFVCANLNQKLGWHTTGLRRLLQLRSQSMVFHWANAELQKKYESGWREVKTDDGAQREAPDEELSGQSVCEQDSA